MMSAMLAAGADLSPLRDIVVLFGLGLGAAWLMRLLRAPAILGFLLAGIVIGPSGFNLIHQARVAFFAELGLVLLLFTVGLELSPDPLLRLGRRLPMAALIQISVTALLATAAVSTFLSAPLPILVLIGFAVALSSTAIVLKQLSDRGEIETPTGTLVTGILIVQDIAVIAVMVVLPLLARSSDASWQRAVVEAGLALGGLVVVTLLARWALPWIVDRVFRKGGRELTTLFAVLVACVGAYLAGLANWSWALGSCIAGLLLAQTAFHHQLRAEITPFRDAFNALFFMSIGMLVNFADVAPRWPALATAIVLTVCIKTVITSGAVRLAGWPLRVSIAVGLGLSSISEFSYVLTAQAHVLGMVTQDVLTLLVAWTVGTMFVGSALVPMARPLGSAIERRLRGLDGPPEKETAAGQTATGHVIIVGYGLNGRNLARVLRATKIPYVVIEMNPAARRLAQEDGSPIITGDATREALLAKAGLDRARALVVAIAEQTSTREIVAQARAARPGLYILARTRYVSELEPLYKLGAGRVIPEEFETSIEIFAYVLKEFGVPDNVIEQHIMLVRAGRYGMLRGLPTTRSARAEWMQVLEAAVTQTYLVPAGSPAIGRTLRELDLRAETGVTVVAITRCGSPQAAPPPDYRIEQGDVLVLVGPHPGLDAVKKRLNPAESEHGGAAQTTEGDASEL